MGSFGYKMKNLFKSKEQIEIESKMEFNRNKKAFTKYYQELNGSIATFTKMARDAELAGNHDNAKSCASFVLKLQKTQTKVQSLLQRFEMMHSMQRLTGVMSNFVQACAKMGFNMDSNINLKSMWKSTAEMEKALGKLDAMTEQMDMIFDTIDSGMGESDLDGMTNMESADAEAEEVLRGIMNRHVVSNYEVETPVQTQSIPANAQENTPAGDDIDERLHKMMEELKD